MSGPYVIEVGPDAYQVVTEQVQGPPGPPGGVSSVAGLTGVVPPGPLAAALAPFLPGGAATTSVSVPFAFGDAASTIYTAPAGGARVVAVALSIRTAFNGTLPTVAVPGVLAAGDSDPKTADIYAFDLDAPLAAGATLTLTISPGGSTTGAGVLTLFFA